MEFPTKISMKAEPQLPGKKIKCAQRVINIIKNLFTISMHCKVDISLLCSRFFGGALHDIPKTGYKGDQADMWKENNCKLMVNKIGTTSQNWMIK